MARDWGKLQNNLKSFYKHFLTNENISSSVNKF